MALIHRTHPVYQSEKVETPMLLLYSGRPKIETKASESAFLILSLKACIFSPLSLNQPVSATRTLCQLVLDVLHINTSSV